MRQRITRDLLGRRGRAIDPTWANRCTLLRGRERLSQRALTRMWNGCIDHDPTGAILTASIAKDQLRALCATAARGGHRDQITQRLWAFYPWCADADVPELITLAQTIGTWWPVIEPFLTTGLTNARTEDTNRLIKQVKRAACGFRNRDNYRRRVRLHCTRQTRRLSARTRRCPPKIKEPLIFPDLVIHRRPPRTGPKLPAHGSKTSAPYPDDPRPRPAPDWTQYKTASPKPWLQRQW